MTTLLVLARTFHIGSALLLVSTLLFNEGVRQHRFTGHYRGGLAGIWLVHLLSGLLWFGLVVADMSEVSLAEVFQTALLQGILPTHFGQLWLGRMSLTLLFGGLLFTSEKTRWRGWKFAFGLGVLVSLAWAGHAASDLTHRAWHISIDVAHLLIAAVWPMGLIPFYFFLRKVRKNGEFAPELIPFIVQISLINLLAAGLVFATGLGNALLLIPNLTALVTSLYGQLLCAKIAAGVILISLGSINRYRLIPKLKKSPITSEALLPLQGVILLEVVLALGIVLIVGLMGAAALPQSMR